MEEKIIKTYPVNQNNTVNIKDHKHDLIFWLSSQDLLKNRLPLNTSLSINDVRSLWIINSSLYQQSLSNIIFEKAEQLNITIEFIDQEWIIPEKAWWIFDNLGKKAILHIPKLIESFNESQNNNMRWGFLQCREANKNIASFFNYILNHELLHGLTMDKYTDLWINTRKWQYNGKRCNEKQLNGLLWLSKIFNHLKSMNLEEIFWWKEYWMENLAEFMAECSNESFLWKLKEIEVPDSIPKLQTNNVFEHTLQYITSKKSINNNIADYVLHCLSDIIS
jgi:hypothetical protein